MKLTDLEVRKAKVDSEKTIRLKDELGLYLEIAPSGIKAWRLRIRSKSGDTIQTLGYYPDMSLAQARKAQAAIRLNGPVAAPPRVAKPTFKDVAKMWHAVKTPEWAENHAANVWASFERDVFPTFGDTAIDQIDSPTIGDLLDRIQAKGVMNRAHDIRQRIERVFSYAKAKGIIASNPATDMKEIMASIPAATPRPAVKTIEDARKVLAAVEAQPGYNILRMASRFQALTSVRSSEATNAKWEQFEGLDGPKPLWIVPAEQMKMGRDHWVPLATQTVELLSELRKLTGGGEYLFPSYVRPSKPLEIGGLRYLLLKAGYAGIHCPHGWRSTFSTVMNGRRKAEREIELMLAHGHEDKVAGIYNRQEYMDVRREIAQEWANILLQGQPSASALAELSRRNAA